jgi:hypothetical protein
MPYLLINPADTSRNVFVKGDPFRRVFDPAGGGGEPEPEPIEDDFGRPNAASQGANWVDVAGGHSIVGNAARSELGSFAKNVSVWHAPTQTLNQWISHSYHQNGNTSGFIGPVFRYEDADSPLYINDFNATQLYWGYYPDIATISGDGQRNIIDGATHGITDGERATWALSGTGAATRLRVWKNPTGDIDPGGVTWGGADPTLNNLIDFGDTADIGKRLGICGFQNTSVVTLDNFSAGDIPVGHSLLNGLVAFWHLDEEVDEEEDKARYNSPTKQNNWTDNATVLSGAGKFGLAADFEASNNEYLSIANNADVRMGNTTYVFSCWVMLESKGANMAIAGKASNASVAESEWLLFYDLTNDRFAFNLYQGESTQGVVRANNLGSPSTGVWYHILVTHDADAGTISIQVNNGTTDSVAFENGANETSVPLTLSSINGAIWFFDGKIDEVGLWKGRILTAAETLYLQSNTYPFIT